MISSFLKEKINASSEIGKASADLARLTKEFRAEGAMHQVSLSRKTLDARYLSAYSRSMVTIAMTVKFDGKSVDVGPHYAKDLAKLATLLRESSGLIATLEACKVANSPFVPVEIVRLRLRNVRNYLVDNFAISRSRFYVDQLMRPLSYNENFGKIMPSYGGVSIILKYPMGFS